MMKRPIRILACDPGLNNFGWCLIEYDIDSNSKYISKYGTFAGKSFLKQQKELQAKFEKRHIILWELEPALVELIIDTQPDYIVSEDAFSYAFVQSYAALVMVIQTIRTASRKTLGRDIYLVAPKESKKAISMDGTADKGLVQSSVFDNPLINIKCNKQNPLDKVTEHVYDSIAHGVAFIQNHLPSIIASEQLIV